MSAGIWRPPRPARQVWSSQTVLLALGILLLAVGLIGIVRTNADMDEVENQAQTVHTPFLTRLLPGLIANPSKFLAAVNGSSGSTGGVSTGGDPFAAVKMLDLRRNMDRFEALFGFGLVSVLLYEARRQPAPDPAHNPDAREHTSIGRDLIPLLGLVATLWALLSFFELP